MSADNRTLGRFILDGIPPAPRGLPQIEVTFDIDVNGILSVKAKDKATNKEQSIRIEASSDLKKEDIERMKQEAQVYAEEDRKKKELAEARNLADGLIYTAEKSIRDIGDKVSEDIKKSVQEKIDALKKTKDSDNIQDIKSKTQELSQELQKIGSSMYQSQGGQDQNKKSEDNIKDAEYKEDDNKSEDKK